jgi:DNA-binding transcriptional regulator YdaS (Cro superfamily)
MTHPVVKFLAKTGIKRSAFARQIGVTPGRVTQICNGEHPSLTVAAAIERVTAGEIKAADLARVTQ